MNRITWSRTAGLNPAAIPNDVADNDRGTVVANADGTISIVPDANCTQPTNGGPAWDGKTRYLSTNRDGSLKSTDEIADFERYCRTGNFITIEPSAGAPGDPAGPIVRAVLDL